MTYEETLDYLYNAAPAFEKVGAGAYKEGLYNTLELDKHFNHPHRRFHTIHVAGTNGKGSVSHTIAALLQAAGHKVGLYTSPHLVDFSERIKINGEPIGRQYVIDFVEKERGFFEPLCPSFFELTTAMAFKYFAEQNVDIAVIEVGLGGRLDCTNVITPLLSVITNISYDHTAFLGDTLAKIAAEKAGIIKPNVPVVIGEYNEETLPVFMSMAQMKSASVVLAEDCHYVIDSRMTEGGEGRLYNTSCYGVLRGQLSGAYQERNTNTFLSCIIPLARQMKRHGIPLVKNGKKPMDCIRTALENVCSLTGLHGRWEKIVDKPLVVCDTGHNLAGWQYLSVQINETYKLRKRQMGDDAKLRIVFGMVDDKDIKAVMALLPHNAVYYFTQADTHRAIASHEVEKLAAGCGLTGKAYKTVGEAYADALSDASPADFIFVGGSSYVVADFLTDLDALSA